ncbi:shikimate dehydrogenase [Desulfosporosinus sp. BICA1-9]|uniref:shikimate dehydrogenase n=1 Tax=Desulfosporosinus sp. BICA1-9 TaxID=1531958 RepID=UPI00054B4965|nr:shikimate dehydrogenase [Desulfosporosinus sp. BICA1-9]KJS49856.1 MAG: shikimate dehydrogenase [Peptococcaceae bacterium BRH_c23]KJS78838.1 MAG: shikimate dehydrogenase [Desulfosporosinus sp. BICA1-9]HBW36187.1 shikimate dehydrogenase [Desulfosporosinus sp.]
MEKHYAVLGDPIQHSLSPGMHNAGYKALGIKAEYHRFRVKPGQLAQAVDGLCALGFSGWNVTIPHKEPIVSLLDSLTSEARRAGAVNTVKIHEGQRIGHNTDGAGFVRSVEAELNGFQAKKAVLLGAGGAAKGIALALAEQGMELHILNRTPEKAKELVQVIQRWGGTATAGEFAPGAWLEDVDLLVQTTSLGLLNESFPFSIQGISKGALVVDIIVNQRETAILREAKGLGCRTQNGLGMLLYQGALAWEFWLGGQAPVEEMSQALKGQFFERLFAKG